MGWRDLIVSSKPCTGVPGKPAEGHSVYFVGFVSKYDLERSLSIQDSLQDSTPSKAPTKYTKPTLATDEVTAPIAPLQPGWLVAYSDPQGRLRGGCDERDHGTIAKMTWGHGSWTVCLVSGEALPLARVRSVAKTDNEGRVIAAWTTRDHGFNGDGASSRVI